LHAGAVLVLPKASKQACISNPAGIKVFWLHRSLPTNDCRRYENARHTVRERKANGTLTAWQTGRWIAGWIDCWMGGWMGCQMIVEMSCASFRDCLCEQTVPISGQNSQPLLRQLSILRFGKCCLSGSRYLTPINSPDLFTSLSHLLTWFFKNCSVWCQLGSSSLFSVYDWAPEFCDNPDGALT
jgi:hypothetical protein